MGKGNTAINVQQLENNILTSINPLVKDYINTVLFNYSYHEKVSEKQEAKTAAALKNYRTKFWNQALLEAKGDKNKAFKIYTQNLK
ncbi:MAG: hypothetical protein Q8R00_04895 [Candidatus Nanoarchaeia archaeon]|nr:hypothetical protein [Candidatus Nanoarchaeia archaeon]